MHRRIIWRTKSARPSSFQTDYPFTAEILPIRGAQALRNHVFELLSSWCSRSLYSLAVHSGLSITTSDAVSGVLWNVLDALQTIEKSFFLAKLNQDWMHFPISSYSTTLNFGVFLFGRNQSRDAIVSLLSGRLLARSARFWQFSLKI